MRKCNENLSIIQHILNAALIWFGGWFIFVIIEVILRLITGSRPWSPLILFTLLLYSSVGITVGGVIGSGIALLLKVVKRWQQKIEIIPLIMSCCIAVITLLYTGLFIHDRLLPLYPSVPRTLVNLAFISFSLIFLISLYIILTRMVDKSRLIVSYLTLSITLYAFIVVGIYINEHLLSGKFLQLDSIRIITNLGIVISSVVLYLILDKIFIFIKKRTDKISQSIPIKVLLAASIVLIIMGGATLYIGTRSTSKSPLVNPSGQAEGKPNVILITMDTTRADHLSCYGYHKKTTPHIDNLVKESAIFQNAYATSPWTLSSHASIFTGMYPSRHDAHYNWQIMKANWPTRLGKQYKTLAEVLVKHGYKTAGVIGGFWCKSAFGLAQGFQYYNEEFIYILNDIKHFVLFQTLNKFLPLKYVAIRHGLYGGRIASQINKIIFTWLEKHYQSPFFLFINYYDPHHPYLPHDQFLSFSKKMKNYEIAASERNKEYLMSHYDEEIVYLDYQMGRLFKKLKEFKIFDNTMIIITSDHGEFFGEHDFWYHSHELYEEVLHVPLIIKYPSFHSQNGVYSKRVSLVDIMPTILNFLKLPIPQDVQGIDLFEDNSRVIAEVYKHKYKKPRYGEEFVRDLKALFLDNYKYIKDSKSRGELYDLNDDPQELYNLIDKMPEKVKEMEAQLVELLPYSESQISVEVPVKLDKTTKENLRALGYIP